MTSRPSSLRMQTLIGGKPLSGVLRWEIQDGVVAQGVVDTASQTKSAAIERGTPIELWDGHGATLRGTVGRRTLTIAGQTRAETLEIETAAILDAPFSAVLSQRKRSEIVSLLLRAAGLKAVAAAGPDDIHPLTVFLAQPISTGLQRFAAMGRTVPLFDGLGGVALVDPTTPRDPRPISNRDFSYTSFDNDDVCIFVRGSESEDWGTVRASTVGGKGTTSKIAIVVPEAVSFGEVENFARTVHACLSAGRPYLIGGPRLAPIVPGTWIHPEGVPSAWLVTTRRRIWTPSAGWQVELSGGFDESALLTPPRTNATRGVVVARDPQSSRVSVRLPLYDVELSVDLLARVAGHDRVDVALPGSGDFVVVQFLEDCPTHGFLIGSPLRPGQLGEAEFETCHAISRSNGFGISLESSGGLQQLSNSWRFVVEGDFNATAKSFDFKPYRG